MIANNVFTPEEISSGACAAWVFATLDGGQQKANERQRSRTAWLDAAEVGAKVARTPEGCETATGGGVPNAYRQRAETTVVGVVWCTTSDGCRHVRVRAERTAAPKSAYGKKDPGVFCLDGGFAGGVYPWLRMKKIAKKYRKNHHPEWLGLVDSLAENGINEADVSAIADYLTDHPEALELHRNDWLKDASEYLGRTLVATSAKE